MLSNDLNRIAVALVYQSPLMHEHVRNALAEVGVRIVYESATDAFCSEDLNNSGASVVVVNLDPAFEGNVDHIDELLLDDSRTVIFNDGEVTSTLSGWDQARWARHLVAKIVGGQDLLPTRPFGAEAIPVVSISGRKALSAAAHDTENLPPDSHSVDDISGLNTALKPALSLDEKFTSGKDIETDKLSVLETLVSELGGEMLLAHPIRSPADDSFINSDLSLEETNPNTAEPESFDLEVQHSDLQDGSADLEIDFDFNYPMEEAAQDPLVDIDSAAVAGLDDFLTQHAISKNSVLEETAETRPEDPVSPRMTPIPGHESTAMELSLVSFDQENNENQDRAVESESDSVSEFFSELKFELEALDNQKNEATTTAPQGSVEENPSKTVLESPPVVTGSPTSSESKFDTDQNSLASLPPLVARESPAENLAADSIKTSGNRGVVETMLQPGAIQRVWVLGASIGGPDAVREFLSAIPDTSPNLFLLAQHMGDDFVDLMIDQLVKATCLEIKMAANGITAKHGQVLVAPLAERLLLEPNGQVSVVAQDKLAPYSPSIDRVLFDIADRFGNRASAIIFSGMAHDAIEGARYLASKGGVVWVQDPETCVVNSMIDGAIEAGVVTFVGSPAGLAQKLTAEFS